jgi:ribosomal protein S18 acetylase RimI-like enzyme
MPRQRRLSCAPRIVAPMPLPMHRKTRQNGISMSEIAIRAARPGDARQIARLDVETWRSTYAGILTTPFLVGLSTRRREVGWAGVIEREPRDVCVAVDADGDILGFGSCGRNRDHKEFAGEVFTLYVAPDWQNQGVGRRLLIALFGRLVAQGCRSAIIWVLHENPARFFYQRLGGRDVRHRNFVVGGQRIEAAGYAWRDLPGFLETAARADGAPEP